MKGKDKCTITQVRSYYVMSMHTCNYKDFSRTALKRSRDVLHDIRWSIERVEQESFFSGYQKNVPHNTSESGKSHHPNIRRTTHS